jgi:hypothetical protein
LPELITEIEILPVVVEIGGIAVRINTRNPEFLRMLQDRYAGFLGGSERVEVEFDVEFLDGGNADPDADVQVSQDMGRWQMSRGDFQAEWEPASHYGRIRQSANPYSMDSVLRIVHTLVLAREGGFLLHAASVIRNGKAFLFAGVSGAGKTTISKLAPPDVTLLTDEISYVRKQRDAYVAFGTPFAGELAKVGENVSAPIAALYVLEKGPQNRIEKIPRAQAARSLLANVLFFAQDDELVRSIFDSAFEFISRVQVFRLTFVPDFRVWELIR